MPETSHGRRPLTSHGSGQFSPEQFARLGEKTVIEPGVLIFHPENIEIGNGVYIGHYTILKGYYHNRMIIGDGSWIGQQCFFHSGGNLVIGKNVGIGPGVKILTSSHNLDHPEIPILHNTILFAEVTIQDDCDIGAAAIILPGVHIGRGVQVGAGAVVLHDVADFAVVAGNPARVIRMRTE